MNIYKFERRGESTQNGVMVALKIHALEDSRFDSSFCDRSFL